VIYPDVLGADRVRGVFQVASIVLGGLALTVGAVALFFRITESPREVSVREYRYWGNPPVIHLDPKS